LFRQEVIDTTRSQWLGSIIVAAPLSRWLLTALAVALAAAILLFLVFGHYTRRETVVGQLVPSGGLLNIAAPSGRIHCARAPWMVTMNNHLQAKGVVAALVLSLIARIGFTSVLSAYLPHDASIVDNLAAISQYALLLVLCAILMRDARVAWNDILGRRPNLAIGRQAALFAMLLLAFSYGENFLEVYVAAQSSPAFAYGFWNFHETHYVLELSTTSFLTLVVAQFVVAPLVEELVFRGLLQRAWAENYGLKKSVVFVALLFTLLHFSRHYFISTFVFSIVLSMLYLRFRSIWVSVGVHAIFNALAFVMEFKFGFHWERPKGHLSSIGFWLPELAMLMIALPFLGIFIRRNWRQLDTPSALGATRKGAAEVQQVEPRLPT
jgi:membrane protease YdiL (CAAX protease family)